MKNLISTSRGVAVVCVLALAGCGADIDTAGVSQARPSVTPESRATVSASELQGAWALESVDAAALPRSMSEREVVAGRLAVYPDGSWIYRYDYRIAGAPTDYLASDGMSGTWRATTARPAAVRFTSADDNTTYDVAMGERGVMTLTLAGHTLRFRRAVQQ